MLDDFRCPVTNILRTNSLNEVVVVFFIILPKRSPITQTVTDYITKYLPDRYIKFFWKEVVPISLAPSLFKNMGKVTTSSIHQDMNLVNNKTSAPPPPAALSLVTSKFV